MQNASDIIDALGGTVAVARALKLTPSTVSSWKGVNRIPDWRMQGIAKLAKKQGIVLSQLPQRAA